MGEESEWYVVSWYMALRCTYNAGGHLASVDTDWGGKCPAVASSLSGIWRHYANDYDPGILSGSLSLGPGSCWARGECWLSGFVYGNENQTVRAMAEPSVRAFGVVTEAPPIRTWLRPSMICRLRRP